MNISKMRFLLLGALVISSGIMLGTLLWLKLAPAPHQLGWQQPLEGLNQFGPVPDFSLVERSGKRIAVGDLRGKIWVADFIYTTCKDTCPLQSAEMSKLQDEWSAKPELRFVSFSVDPDHDTPAVLSQYAKNFKADGDRWLFLTGDKKQLSHLIQDGFRLSAAPLTQSDSQDQVILHSPRFVLIDKKTQIRGYYDSRDPEALARLSKDVVNLTNGTKE